MPRQGVSNVYPPSMFLSKNKKIITIFHLKNMIFTAVKNRWMLHGRVFVMSRGRCIKVSRQRLTHTDLIYSVVVALA